MTPRGRRGPALNRRLASREQAGEPRPGLVVAGHGRRVGVADDDGASYSCTVPPRLSVVTGDRVAWRRLSARKGVIEACEPRQSELARPDERGRRRVIAANVDLVLVVTAPRPTIPDPVLDAYLVAAEHLELEAGLVFNKADLLLPDETADTGARIARYERAGYACLSVSTEDGTGIDALRARLGGRSSVLIGPSGVGKSSLIRALVPGADPEVGALVQAGSHGAHTTSASRLYALPHGGSIIDSPGVREFGLWQMSPRLIADGFPELRVLAPGCRFRDCLHRHEPGCAAAAALAAGALARERYESYLALLRLYGE